MARSNVGPILLLLAAASLPVTPLRAQETYGVAPGSLNFVQGQANIDGQPLNTQDPHAAYRQLHAGETLATADGSADILLAPGALLRIGRDSTVQMVTADRNRTEVRLQQGLANVSVNTVRHDDLLLIDLPQGQTQLLSHGLYTFNFADKTVRVFNGEAYAFPGADTASNVKPQRVKEGHEIALTGEKTKPASFDRDTADPDLLPWTGPRESRAALADATVRNSDGAAYSDAGYGAGALGFGPYGYGYGDAFAYGGGWGYPGYGPYGFGGYPFFGVGFLGGGFYGGGYPIGGPGRLPGLGPGHYPGWGTQPGAVRGGAIRSGTAGVAGGSRSLGAGSFHGGGGAHR